MNGRTPQQLFSWLNKHYDLSELRQLAFTLGIDHENLEGSTKRDFILALVGHAQRHALIDELEALIEEVTPVQQPFTQQSFWQRMSFSTKVTIVSIIVTVLGIFVTLISFFPDTLGITSKATLTPTDKILLQVQVVNSENQTALANAKVSLHYADALFPQERTDSTGLAIFSLPAEADGNLVRITVEANGQVETQNITVGTGMRVVVFQILP